MSADLPAVVPARTPGVQFPRAVFCLGVAILVAGLVLRAEDTRGALQITAEALLVAYLAWLFSEAPVTFRRAAAAPTEFKSLVPYALARIGIITGGALGPLPWSVWSPWLVAPAAVFLLGVTMRHAAIRTLGRYYSHHVMRQEDHRVVTQGLYRFIRHPSYAGMLLANLGFTVFFFNLYDAVALLLLATAVAYRILREERVLWQVRGYPSYATGKARLLPGVW